MKNFFSFLGKWIMAFLRSVGNLVLRYPVATALTVILLVVAIPVFLAGKNLQLGGLLGRLWGTRKVDARGTVAPDRKKNDGTSIQPGESDENGYVQVPSVTEIEDPGLFSDPSTVTVVHSDGKKVVVELPEGVKNSDVKEVVVLKPDVKETGNNDKSAIDVGELYELLMK